MPRPFVHGEEMLDTVSGNDRRSALLTSRLHHGPEFSVPRQNALEAMIENILFLAKADEWFGAEEVILTLEEMSGFSTLQIRTVEDALRRLLEQGRIQAKCYGTKKKFRLSESVDAEVTEAYSEESKRLIR